jgi:glycosyltransferase involved in cell wall biosynthesis
MPQPKLTVILPTYNRAGSLEQALGALLRQQGDPDDYEVVVVDNNSTDGTRELVQGLDDSRIRLIAEPRQGLSYARNAGLDAARAPLLPLTDNN